MKFQEELLKRLDKIIELQSAAHDDQIKSMLKEIAKLHDWKIKMVSSAEARNGVFHWVVKYWPGVLALIVGAVELKRLKP